MTSVTALILRRFKLYLFSVESKLLSSLGLQPHFQDHIPAWDVTEYPYPDCSQQSSTEIVRSPLSDLIGDRLLWAVPTRRRSIERRLTRRLAEPKKMKPLHNLMMCTVCGHYHQGHTICGNCYEKVRKETEVMQTTIENEWKLDPVDKEVVLVYDNDDKENEFWKGKRIVELKRERPPWFHQNLQVKTNNPDASNETSLQPSKSIIPNVK